MADARAVSKCVNLTLALQRVGRITDGAAQLQVRTGTPWPFTGGKGIYQNESARVALSERPTIRYQSCSPRRG